MERKALALPELAIISGTRAMLGAGIGLLIADRLSDDQRRAVGWTLLGVGALTTIPILVQLLSSPSLEAQEDGHPMRSRRYEFAK